jgi:hypothetical protein
MYFITGLIVGLIPGMCVAVKYHYKKWKQSK